MVEQLALTFPTWFFEILIEWKGEPLVLEPFQIAYLLDQSPLKVSNKTRQAGASMVVSMAKFFRAYTRPGYRCQIISINLRESVDKINYIRTLYDTLPRRYKIPLTLDNALSIGFHKGARISRIESIAASGAVRGGSKELVLDEFAHFHPIGKDKLIFEAAAPAIINGELQLDIISTPNGKGNYFDRIFNNLEDERGRKPFDLFSRHEFIWLDVKRFVREGKYDEVQHLWHKEYNKDMSKMEALVHEYASDRLMFFYEIYGWSMFLQEFCGSFLNHEGAFITWDLVRQCVKGDIEAASNGIEVYTEDSTSAWTERPKGNKHDVYMGIDFGQSGEDDDKTSIQIFERTPEGIFKHRYSEYLDKKDYPTFPAQADHIGRVIRAFQPTRIGADNTGLGLGVIPLIVERVPNASIERINFTHTKEEMAHRAKSLMQNDQVWLLSDAHQLHAEIAGIRRSTTALGTPTYAGSPHDDGFWAMAMALKVGETRPITIYQIGGSNPFSSFPF